MAYRRSYGSRGRKPRSGGVRRSSRSAGSRRASYKPLRGRKRMGSRRGYSRRSTRSVPQILRIELAPGLSVGGGGAGGIARPVSARRTKTF